MPQQHHQTSQGQKKNYMSGQQEIQKKQQSSQNHYNRYIEGQIGEIEGFGQQPSGSGLGGPQLNQNQVVKASGGKEHAGHARPKTNSAEASDSDENDSNEDLGEEPDYMRVSPEFLKNIPGVQATDSMFYRIEALRVYLETKLGEEPFIAAYKHFVSL